MKAQVRTKSKEPHQRDEAQRAHHSLKSWHHAIVAAVHPHPDGTQIMKSAADRSSGC
ncbi:hypothetical protein ACFTWS_33515 [Streptomyces sp. NPDC057027]|uniref:hypothetical protein n=1 Tax=Streptomyces sp. NPDC057027 TaxID=3346004 RepID=UPI00362BC4F4